MARHLGRAAPVSVFMGPLRVAGTGRYLRHGCEPETQLHQGGGLLSRWGKLLPGLGRRFPESGVGVANARLDKSGNCLLRSYCAFRPVGQIKSLELQSVGTPPGPTTQFPESLIAKTLRERAALAPPIRQRIFDI